MKEEMLAFLYILMNWENFFSFSVSITQSQEIYLFWRNFKFIIPIWEDKMVVTS